jgi:hypothetical protein
VLRACQERTLTASTSTPAPQKKVICVLEATKQNENLQDPGLVSRRWKHRVWPARCGSYPTHAFGSTRGVPSLWSIDPLTVLCRQSRAAQNVNKEKKGHEKLIYSSRERCLQCRVRAACLHPTCARGRSSGSLEAELWAAVVTLPWLKERGIRVWGLRPGFHTTTSSRARSG